MWEIVIKQAIGKITEPEGLPEIVRGAGFRHLPITADHATAGKLPLLHGDPFDRMLVAQAGSENLTLVTRDPEIHNYDLDLLRIDWPKPG